RVEDDLAIDLAPGAKGPPGKDRTVLEREFRRVHRHYRGRSAATPEPGCLIQTTQSYPVRCSCVESRPRGRPGPFHFRSGIGRLGCRLRRVFDDAPPRENRHQVLRDYFVYFPHSGLDATVDAYFGLATASGDVRI